VRRSRTVRRLDSRDGPTVPLRGIDVPGTSVRPSDRAASPPPCFSAPSPVLCHLPSDSASVLSVVQFAVQSSGSAALRASVSLWFNLRTRPAAGLATKRRKNALKAEFSFRGSSCLFVAITHSVLCPPFSAIWDSRAKHRRTARLASISVD